MPLSYSELELLHDLLEQAVEFEQIQFWPGPDQRHARAVDLVGEPGQAPYVDVDLC